MKKLESTTQTRNQIEAIGKIIGIDASRGHYRASVSVWYSTGSGEENIQFVFTENDQEFQEFLNAWGARKAAELLISGE